MRTFDVVEKRRSSEKNAIILVCGVNGSIWL